MARCFKVIIFFAAFLATTLHSAPTIWDGSADTSWYSNSSAQTYSITTAEQLAGLALLVNNGTSDFSGKTINLISDIFLNDTAGWGEGLWDNISHKTWTPIGNQRQSKPFKGEFDGIAGAKNRKIYGLYINNASSDGQGFFGHTDGVNISNLDLLVGSIVGNSDVGSLIGNAVGGTTSNIYSTVKVEGKKRVGGLVGRSTGTIRRSYHIGNVLGIDSVGGLAGLIYDITGTATSKCYHIGNLSGRNYVGGLAGIIRGTIKNAYFEGDVSGGSYIGGIAGMSEKNIDSIYFEGNVTATGDYVGGLAGQSSGKISNSHSIGEINGAGYVGGLVGGGTEINNSYSIGDVKSTKNNIGGLAGYLTENLTSSYSIGNISGQDSVGGLAGYTTSRDILGTSNDTGYTTFSKGNVSGRNYVGGLVGRWQYSIDKGKASIANVYSIGDVSGASYIGGLIGYSKGYASSTVITIKNAYSQGKVTGTKSNIGGLVGYMYYGNIISANHTNGDVSGQDSVGGLVGYANSNYILGTSDDTGYTTFSKSNVSGRNYVGGIVGRLQYSYPETIDSVVNVYSIGDVSGASYIGGLIGYSNGYSNGYSASYKKNIKNIYSQGKVTGTKNNIGGLIGYVSYGNITSASHTSGDVSGKDSIGGLVGYFNDGTISNSHSICEINGNRYIGGLVGSIEGSILNSYAKGDVTGSGNYIGGLVGYTTKGLTSVYSDGFVVGIDTVGGLVGYVEGAVRDAYAIKKVKGRNMVGGLIGYDFFAYVINSYFSGDSVIGIFQVGGLIGEKSSGTVDSVYSIANVKGDDNIGGLIGSSYGTVSNSYALGNVIGDVENSSAGNDNIGGLIGYAHSGSILKSFALGNVSGTTKLGGLVGRMDTTRISQSYANGNVTGSFYGDPADEIGNYYIGGLIGYGKGGTLTESYASGVVSGILENPVFTGCLVGYADETMTISKSYYDGENCGLSLADGSENFSIPSSTTNEMQTQSTFIDWDFAGTWKIFSGTYPYLKIFTNSLTNAIVATASLDGIQYDGTAKTPLVTSVELFGNPLILGADYSVDYKNNVDVGEATIEVCGVGVYGGCKKIKFNIALPNLTPTTITTNPTASSIVYGAPLSNSTLSGGSANVAGTFSWEVPTIKPTVANSGYSIKFTPNDAGTYAPSYAIIPITVSKTILTVTAADKTKTYNSANPTLTFSYSGFVSSENASALTTEPTASTIATTGSNVGDYDITVSGGVANNYSFNYVSGTLKINKAAGTFKTLAALSTTYSATLKLSDIALPANYAWVTPSTAIASAGNGKTYSATYTDPSGNYNYATGNLTINVAKADIFPTLSLVGWIYGETENNPSVSGNTSGGEISYSYSTSPIGTFASIKPNTVGTYYVKATIAATTNYNSATTNAVEFVIASSNSSSSSSAVPQSSSSSIEASSSSAFEPNSSSSSDGNTPIYSAVFPLATSNSPLPIYYNLQGQPLGTSKPKSAGAYIMKTGRVVKMVMVK